VAAGAGRGATKDKVTLWLYTDTGWDPASTTVVFNIFSLKLIIFCGGNNSKLIR